MKKIIAAILVSAFVCVGVVQAKPVYVTASQNYITQDITGLKPFAALLVSGQAEVDLRQGEEGQSAVSVYGPDNLVNLVQITSDGQTLSVQYKEPLIVLGEDHLKVMVTVPSLTRVEVRQTGEVSIYGPFTAQELTLVADGKGEIDFASVNATAVKAHASGDGEIGFDALSCQTLQAVTSGTAGFDAERTVCDNIDVKAFGRSEASVSGLSGRTVTALSEGNSEIELKGSVLTATLTARGKSELDAGSLVATNATVTASDSAVLETRVTDTLNAEATGRAIVEYKGWPKTVNRSGKSGNIRMDH